MLQTFQSFIDSNSLFCHEQKGLLAVSGGVDSVVLCHLMHLAAYPFAIAHCNFHLRPGACDRDERFVRQLAQHYGVEIYVAQFDTLAYAHSHHLSVEEAARRLRYDFFEQTRAEHHLHYIATAHHRDDATETFFLNLLRGTGISGLHGILPRCGNVVRPMLPFGRDEIERFASAEGLLHVEDATNQSTRYQRNRIRLQLMPLLRQMAPAIDATMQANISRLADVEQVYNATITTMRQHLLHQQPQGVTIAISDVLALSPRRTLLFELLRPYRFRESQVDQLLRALTSTQSGQQFLSPTHRLQRLHDQLLITPLSAATAAPPWPAAIEIPTPDDLLRADTVATILRAQCMDNTGNLHFNRHCAYFDADTLRFPLWLRHWHDGDRIRPYGMRGTKLVSDILTEHHLSAQQKDSQWILCDATGTLLWVVGLRASAHCPVTDSTRRLLILLPIPTDTV